MKEYIDIPDYEGYYQINGLGEVRSIDRWVFHPLYPNKTCFVKGKVLKQSIDNHGYLKVGLSKNNILRNIRVHVLLGKIFIPNPNNYPLIRHLNDKKLDNRLENLSWGSDKDNANDCVRNGTHIVKRGKEHHWYGRKETWNKGKGGNEASASKLVCDLETGIFYYGCTEAGMAKGINHNTLRAKLCGISKNNTSLIYV